MTEIPEALSEYMPMGTILPFLDERDVPFGWLTLKGQTISNDAFPGLIAKMWAKWNEFPSTEAKLTAKDWWESKGGLVTADQVVFPVIPHDEVFTLAFNTTIKPKDAKPVLAIKAMRSVTGDGSR